MTRTCVPNKLKNMHVKVFNVMSEVNETRFLVQHESCECECRLNESVCNSKQKWNHDKCRFECKKINDWGSCKNDFMLNPSTRDFACNKACKIIEYLDTKDFSCVKRLVCQSVLECEDEILNITEAFDKKITCKKSNCFLHMIQTILLVIICLLLLVVIC